MFASPLRSALDRCDAVRLRRARVKIAQRRELRICRRLGHGDVRRELHGPSRLADDLLTRDAWMHADDLQLLRLLMRPHRTQIADEEHRALRRQPHFAALTSGAAMA